MILVEKVTGWGKKIKHKGLFTSLEEAFSHLQSRPVKKSSTFWRVDLSQFDQSTSTREKEEEEDQTNRNTIQKIKLRGNVEIVGGCLPRLSWKSVSDSEEGHLVLRDVSILSRTLPVLKLKLRKTDRVTCEGCVVRSSPLENEHQHHKVIRIQGITSSSNATVEDDQNQKSLPSVVWVGGKVELDLRSHFEPAESIHNILKSSSGGVKRPPVQRWSLVWLDQSMRVHWENSSSVVRLRGDQTDLECFSLRGPHLHLMALQCSQQIWVDRLIHEIPLQRHKMVFWRLRDHCHVTLRDTQDSLHWLGRGNSNSLGQRVCWTQASHASDLDGKHVKWINLNTPQFCRLLLGRFSNVETSLRLDHVTLVGHGTFSSPQKSLISCRQGANCPFEKITNLMLLDST